MNKAQRILSILTYITGIFVIVCYSVYLISCIIQQNYFIIFLPAVIIALASAAMILRRKTWMLLKLILCAGMSFYMLTFSAFVVYAYSLPETNLVYDESSVVVVFGCRTYGMNPGRILKSRLDCAFEILESDSTVICVVSGGRGPNETVTEAKSMRGYLINRGIAPERILTEDYSGNTAENIKYTRQILDVNDLLNSTIVGVSSIYHLPRIRMLAEKNNLSIVTVSADASNVFLTFSDTVREYMAWVKAIILIYIN